MNTTLTTPDGKSYREKLVEIAPQYTDNPEQALEVFDRKISEGDTEINAIAAAIIKTFKASRYISLE